MSSLDYCLKKIGNRLGQGEKNSLLAAAKAYREEGYAGNESGVRAMRDAIKDLEEEWGDIEKQAAAKGWSKPEGFGKKRASTR